MVNGDVSEIRFATAVELLSNRRDPFVVVETIEFSIDPVPASERVPPVIDVVPRYIFALVNVCTAPVRPSMFSESTAD
jgi:hypothetical protein